MKKLVFIFILVAGAAMSSHAQNYQNAVGLRAGLGGGVTFKHFLNRTAALEGIVYMNWNGGNITGLYEVHQGGFNDPNFKWYYGGGGHIGFYNAAFDRYGRRYVGGNTLGLDGIVGIEYTFSEAPLNLSFDWKPSVEIFGFQGFWFDEFALSVRFVIN